MNKTGTTTTSAGKTFAPPLGFRFGAVAAGVKAGGRGPARRRAHRLGRPVRGGRRLHRQQALRRARGLRRGRACRPTGIRAIVANSGNANALTGPVGAEDERAVAAAVAKALSVERRTTC